MHICWQVTEEDEEIVSVAFTEEPESQQSKAEQRAANLWLDLTIFVSGVLVGACVTAWLMRLL
ncbi:MAG: hypothetical protein ACLPLR_06100 [Terriglobales bacterium]